MLTHSNFTKCMRATGESTGWGCNFASRKQGSAVLGAAFHFPSNHCMIRIPCHRGVHMGVSAELTSYAWWLLGQSTAFPVARHTDAYFELQWSNDSVLDNPSPSQGRDCLELCVSPVVTVLFSDEYSISHIPEYVYRNVFIVPRHVENKFYYSIWGRHHNAMSVVW